MLEVFVAIGVTVSWGASTSWNVVISCCCSLFAVVVVDKLVVAKVLPVCVVISGVVSAGVGISENIAKAMLLHPPEYSDS